MRNVVSSLLVFLLVATVPAIATPPLVGFAPWVTGSYGNGAVVLTAGSPTQIFAAPGAGITRYRIVLQNADYPTQSGGSGISVWCAWNGVTPVVRGVGSFLMAPGFLWDITGSAVPQGALSCVPESGSPLFYAEEF